ncbi:unnamed protein product [Menidia menidia]|uniref:(Atlantic silverside) hypothetical protein n=1 Tax=Menidia menidia TaxID=238744 RepID=A0A8S4AXW7_9TELE|nr:unnamed protein product [Menidia menidia]
MSIVESQRFVEDVRMSVHFSGWEAVDDGASSPGVMLGPSQTPQNKGVYTMFHGTKVLSAKQIITNGFNQSSSGMLGRGVYMSRDKSKAANYPAGGTSSDQVILELRVRVGRVKRIDKDNHPLQLTWNQKGYDTAWVPRKCGMSSVPSGREEDCVFDPKRVQVVGIAKAPDNKIEQELLQLIKKGSKSGNGAANVCSLCKRATQKGTPHVQEQCWKCRKNICILMSKHFCS